MPDGTPMVAINVNCLDGVDPRALPARHVDGRAPAEARRCAGMRGGVWHRPRPWARTGRPRGDRPRRSAMPIAVLILALVAYA